MPEHLDAWSRDGKYLYFSSGGYDIGAGAQDIYRISAHGGTPMPVAHEAYVNEFFAAPHPKTLRRRRCSGGMADRTWWRKGHNHGDECEIDLLTAGKTTPDVQRLTPVAHMRPLAHVDADGGSLYYVSDRSGCFNLHVKTPGGEHRQITHFTDGRVHWPSISYDGRTIVYERGNGIWTLDTANGETREVPIKLLAALRRSPRPITIPFPSSTSSRSAPDGRKIAPVTHGEIFAASSARHHGPATGVTKTAAIESHVTALRQPQARLRLQSRRPRPDVFLYYFATGEETKLTSGDDDTRPRSPPMADRSPISTTAAKFA